ncbi:ABC transporter permease [Paenibacillus sp. 1011MAR3C5]|uniref:ABC transporter permease n=1 Tax=Paenibacillus sp. 1011MAR3C5 TaxID=1675787 RepID=UPI000E6BBB20|nr:ABC transporter permease [Paenibacillus sp. 1011MAR3C5]RJE85127.1 ABC transporter permease [Paenibacillus sp. 1011MAR3C5]
MNIIASRNMKLFFRDRRNVVMSFLSVFIILGLYILFLGDTLKSGVPDSPGIGFLLDSWVMAGILAVTSVTATLGALGIMVEDRTQNILKDFKAAPIKRYDLVGGYLLSAFTIGVVLSLVTLVLAEIYIVIQGGEWLPLVAWFKVIGFILLSVLASSAIVFFITSLLNSRNSFSTTGTIIGTLIGFLTGIYIPIGSLPEPVQWMIKVFPVSHAGALIRSVMVERPMEASFAGASAEAVQQFKLDMGVVYQYGDTFSSAALSIAVLVGTTVLFYLLSIAVMARKTR